VVIGPDEPRPLMIEAPYRVHLVRYDSYLAAHSEE
jgi:hypothetical protein